MNDTTPNPIVLLHAIKITHMRELIETVEKQRLLPPHERTHWAPNIQGEALENHVTAVVNKMWAEESRSPGMFAKGALNRNPCLARAARVHGIKTAKQWNELWDRARAMPTNA